MAESDERRDRVDMSQYDIAWLASRDAKATIGRRDKVTALLLVGTWLIVGSCAVLTVLFVHDALFPVGASRAEVRIISPFMLLLMAWTVAPYVVALVVESRSSSDRRTHWITSIAVSIISLMTGVIPLAISASPGLLVVAALVLPIVQFALLAVVAMTIAWMQRRRRW